MSTLTPQTKIQVGLAVTLVGAAAALYLQVDSVGDALRHDVSDLSDRVEARYISKELFSAEMASMRRESEMNVRTLGEKLTELKADVSALKAAR